MEEDAGGSSRQRESRQSREAGGGSLERRVEELERELAIVLQEQSRLLKALQDKDELIEKQKEEIELLNLDLDEIEDENEQLKQENKTLLKVVGQLTR
ncbi:PRKC apoptosis WT1 regulator protein-like [Fundulus heteroclitus]|nr:PRKC apoptosis WT1 regulator protein-like [Fundulus heteroclitus]